MAHLIYINEAGWQGIEKTEPLLWLVGLVVNESAVSDLDKELHDLAVKHLGKVPTNFEFNGIELLSGAGFWSETPPKERIEALEDAVRAIERLDLWVVCASIDKKRLRVKYEGEQDENAYLIALQYLLEKIDNFGGDHPKYDGPKTIFVDETTEGVHDAAPMVAQLRQKGHGIFPGIPDISGPPRPLTTISYLHLVTSFESPGIQLAGLAALALQRESDHLDTDPETIAAFERIISVVNSHRLTHRMTWP